MEALFGEKVLTSGGIPPWATDGLYTSGRTCTATVRSPAEDSGVAVLLANDVADG